jgi:hypothetical protein
MFLIVLFKLAVSLFILLVCCLFGGPIGFVGWVLMMGFISISQAMMYNAAQKAKQ